MPPLLDVRGLKVAYGRLQALTDVSLVVPEGLVVALLGANGAGKSTLLKTVAGLVPPQAGQIRYDGRSLHGVAAHERFRAGICLIPEGRGIFPSLTVADNLEVALGGDAGAVRRVTEFFPVLGERLGQPGATLSGGEQQMLALARAVGGRARLLMADELSLGLAPKLVGVLAETLQHLHEEQGQTILLVEQYAGLALRLAELVFILVQGSIAWAGQPDELRRSRVLMEAYLGDEAAAPRGRRAAGGSARAGTGP